MTFSSAPSKIKAIFFDIDGTLVSFKTKQIPQSTERALAALKRKGIKIIISTGRSINSIKHVRHLEFDGFITFNGGCCLTHDDQLLSRKTIDPQYIRALLDHSLHSPVRFSLMYQDRVVISEVTDEVVSLYQHVNLPVPPMLDRDAADVDNVLQACVYLGPDEEQAFMKDVMPGCVATRWTHVFADVNHLDVSKQKGVDVFCSHFGIDKAETMAFGDGGNDIGMLKHAGVGVAMGNASDNVKAVADYVTDTVDDDGIVKGLLKYGVLEEAEIEWSDNEYITKKNQE